MLRCTECRPLILDHLFGLLDAPEITAVAAHLSTCQSCAAERTEAAKMHGLIAKAAKIAFPAVRFEAPDARPAARPPLAKTTEMVCNAIAAPLPSVNTRTPVTPAAPKEQRATRNGHARTLARGSTLARIIPWAIAAAVLVAIPGTVVPVLDLLNQAKVARRDADDSAARAADALRVFESTGRNMDEARSAAHAKLLMAKQAHDGLLAKWVSDEKAAALNQDTRRLTWEVMKPAAVQPGAPNEFLLVVNHHKNAPSGRVIAEFLDQSDAVIYSQPINHETTREHPIRLPAGAWTKLKPESELFLVVSRVDDKTQVRTVLQEKVKLLGPVFTTVLTTDKPKYWPGETVRFRSLTLDRVTFTPPTREQLLHFELRDPKGAVVRNASIGNASIDGSTNLVRVIEGNVSPLMGPDGNPVRGIGTGEFMLPFDSPEGEYTLTMRELPHPSGNPAVVPFPVTRTIRVESGVPEIFNKKLTFGAASYSAGDTVEATVELKLKGEPVVGAQLLSAIAVIDDQVMELVDFSAPPTNAKGNASFRFVLPEAITNGDARLKVKIRAASGKEMVEEVVANRIPVVGPNLVVEFFPEGGDLVAGVPCRVYVRATTPSGLPVEISGTITDGRRTLATVKTVQDEQIAGVNRGLGVFNFVPELGTPLWLKIATPNKAYSPLLVPEINQFPTVPAAIVGAPGVMGARTGFLLPDVKTSGVVITVPNPVTSPGTPIRVHLRSVGRERKLVVGAYTRGRLADTQTITAAPDQLVEAQLLTGADPRGGVVRVTVFEEPEHVIGQPKSDLIPVAERLVFRRPGEGLNLNVAPLGKPRNPDGYYPNTRIGLNLTATDEKGNPAAAILYAAVVNSAVASDAKDRLLTTHFLIAGEVNTPDQMEYADFLLTDHAKAAESLDLVLATQGWRRFAEQVPAGFARKPVAPTQEQANLLVCNGQYMTTIEPPAFQAHQKLRDLYWPRYESAVRNLDAAKAAAEAAELDRSKAEGIQQLAREANEARELAKQKVDQAQAAGVPVEQFRSTGWFAVGGFGLLALMLAVACFTRSSGRLPLGIGSMGAVGIVAFLIVALGTADQTHAAAAKEEVVKLQVARLPEADRTPNQRPMSNDDDVSGSIQSDDSPERESRDKNLPGKDEQGRPMEKKQELNGIGGLGGGGGLLGVAGEAFGPADGAAMKQQTHGPGAVLGGVGVAPSQAKPNTVFGGNNRVEKQNPNTPPRAPGAGMVGVPANSPAGKPDTGFLNAVLQDAARQNMDSNKLAEGGSQLRNFRREIPENLLPGFGPFKRDRAAAAESDRDALAKKFSNRRDEYYAQADGKGSAEAKERKAASEQYWGDVEKAKDYADKRSKEIQSHLREGLARQLKVLEEARKQPTPIRGGLTATAAAPAYPGRTGAVVVPAETRAIYNVGASASTTHPLVVREYAAPRPGTNLKDKGLVPYESDTILWQPVIVLPSSGKMILPVQLGTAPGGYEVIVAGHTLDGRIGATRGFIQITEAVPPTLTPAVLPTGTVGPKKP